MRVIVDTHRPFLKGGRFQAIELDCADESFWNLQAALGRYDATFGTHLRDRLGEDVYIDRTGEHADAPILDPASILPKTWGIISDGEVKRVASEPEFLAGDGLVRGDSAIRFDMLAWIIEGRYDDYETFGSIFADPCMKSESARREVISAYLEDFRFRAWHNGEIIIHWRHGETVRICPVRPGNDGEPRRVRAEVF